MNVHVYINAWDGKLGNRLPDQTPQVPLQHQVTPKICYDVIVKLGNYQYEIESDGKVNFEE